jgi:hypothetical protein
MSRAERIAGVLLAVVIGVVGFLSVTVWALCPNC